MTTPRGVLWGCALAFWALSCHCTVDRVVAISGGGVDGGEVADAGGLEELALERQWGVFADALPIRRCTDGGVLVVDTLDDLLEGGPGLNDRAAAGTTLSLREALFLATNTPGPHLVTFDPAVFPPGAATTIHVTDDALPYPGGVLVDTCIDGRGRGVIVEFAFTDRCAHFCSWALGSGSQLTGLVLKGNMGKIGVSEALVAGNRLMIAYQALQVTNGSVIGPWNVFGHGTYGVRLDFYFGANPTQVVIDGNYFGLEPTTMRGLDLRVAVTLFTGARFTNNVGNAALQLTGTEGGTVASNTLLQVGNGAPYVTVSGSGWRIGPLNHFEGSVNNFTSGGNSFFQNVIVGAFTSTGLTAPIADAGLGSVTGACPADGTVEVYTRAGSTWAPVSSVTCTPASAWSLASPALAFGLEAGTLFTETTNGNTGPFSPTFPIPSSP